MTLSIDFTDMHRNPKDDGVTKYAERESETKDFIDDLEDLFRKHNLALVPVSMGNNRVSFHDPMRVVPLTEADIEYLRERTGMVP